MNKLITTNIDKLVPAAGLAGTRIGNCLGEKLNDAIDRAVAKAAEIITEHPVIRDWVIKKIKETITGGVR